MQNFWDALGELWGAKEGIRVQVDFQNVPVMIIPTIAPEDNPQNVGVMNIPQNIAVMIIPKITPEDNVKNVAVLSIPKMTQF